LESGLKEKEDSSIIESSLYNHRNLFKKNRSNSITKAEAAPEETQQQPVKLGLKLYSQKKTDKIDHSDKKSVTTEKMSLNNDLQNLLSAQKKIENLDKNGKMKMTNPKNKFFLNNSFKSVQFNTAFKKSNTVDSNTKRSPSISNSNLPTDLPSSMKVTTSGRPKAGALLNTQKVGINNKDKVLHMKYGFTTQLTSFSDYKSLNQYKTSVETYSKFIPNIRYPYYFVDFPEQNVYPDDHGKMLFDEARCEKATCKNLTKWKEDMRKKLEGRRNKSRVNSIGQE